MASLSVPVSLYVCKTASPSAIPEQSDLSTRIFARILRKKFGAFPHVVSLSDVDLVAAYRKHVAGVRP
jgi:hypothetical protein